MSKYKDATDAVEGIVKAVPIYQDLLQPAMVELGKGIHTLSKTVHIALSPISALIWGYDQIKDFIQQSLEDKLKNIPRENIISPAPEVAVPAIEALRYLGHREELREMFSRLLATSMNAEMANLAHPSFVEILKQISSDEAKILKSLNNNNFQPIIHLNMFVGDTTNFIHLIKNFTTLPYQVGCEFPQLGVTYIENIFRLGLIHVLDGTHITEESSYDELINHSSIHDRIAAIERAGMKADIKKIVFYRTSYGEKFYNACIKT
jgi:hypothetical protein